MIGLPEDEAERAATVLVGQVYPDPLGGGGSVRRLEPAGIAAKAKSADEDEVATWNAKRAELRAELARLEANAPLVARPPAGPSVTAPVLRPSITGVRQAPPMGGGPAETIDLAGATAEQTAAFLTQHPDQVDAVAAAEEARPGGRRETVTDAVAGVRRPPKERGA